MKGCALNELIENICVTLCNLFPALCGEIVFVVILHIAFCVKNIYEIECLNRGISLVNV